MTDKLAVPGKKWGTPSGLELFLRNGRVFCMGSNIPIYTTMLSDERIAQFQAIYKKHFGKEISREDALEQGTKLIRMMELIYKPMTQAEYNLLQKRRKETE